MALSKWSRNDACVFSLPTDTRNVYVTVSNGDTTVIRRVLSALEEIEVQSTVKLGNVALLDSPELRARKIVGVLLLPPHASNALNHLPLQITIRDVVYRFMLVVFLTEREHDLWKTAGHNALMDFFSSSDKDLVAFGDP